MTEYRSARTLVFDQIKEIHDAANSRDRDEAARVRYYSEAIHLVSTELLPDLAVFRAVAVSNMRLTMSVQQIATEIGITPARVYAILSTQANGKESPAPS